MVDFSKSPKFQKFINNMHEMNCDRFNDECTMRSYSLQQLGYFSNIKKVTKEEYEFAVKRRESMKEYEAKTI